MNNHTIYILLVSMAAIFSIQFDFESRRIEEAADRHNIVLNTGNHCELFDDLTYQIWHTGGGGGLDFGNLTNGYPSPLSTGSAMPGLLEGAATFCHPTSGEVLLYSDGLTAWDSDGNAFATPGGGTIFSNLSDNQSSATGNPLIIPPPGQSGVIDSLYIFYSDDHNSPTKELYFVIADLNAQEISEQVQLTSFSTSEQAAAVRVSCDSIWLIFRGEGASGFDIHSLLWTPAGFGDPANLPALPLTINDVIISPDIHNSDDGRYGFTFSNDGTKFAATFGANNEPQSVEEKITVCDFDLQTGLFSNPVYLDPFTLFSPPGAISRLNYGIAFSPDNSKVYTSGFEVFNEDSFVFVQFDLNAGTGSELDVQASIYSISSTTFVGGMKPGPDGRLYLVKSQGTPETSTTVHVVDAPNNDGPDVNFLPDFIDVGGTLNSNLNSFVFGECLSGCISPCNFEGFADLIYSDIAPDNPELATNNGIIPNLTWIGYNDFSVAYEIEDTINLFGSRVNRRLAGFLTEGDYTTEYINLGYDNSQNIPGLRLSTKPLNRTNISFQFTDNPDNFDLIIWDVDQTDSCWINILDDMGQEVAIENFSIGYLADVETSPLAIWHPDENLLAAPPGNVGGFRNYFVIHFENQAVSEINLVITGHTLLDCDINDNIFCPHIYLSLYAKNLPNADAGTDQIICNQSTVQIGGSSTATGSDISYSWIGPGGFSSNELFTTVNEPGVYTLTLTRSDIECTQSSSDSVLVSFSNIDVQLPDDIILCADENYQVEAIDTFCNDCSFEWNVGSMDSILTITTSGLYIVTITDNLGCTASDSIQVVFSVVPEIEAIPDRVICEGARTILCPAIINCDPCTYLWSDGSGVSNFSADSTGTYSLLVTNGQNCSTEQFFEVSEIPCPDIDTISYTCGADKTIDVYGVGVVDDFDGTSSLTIPNPASVRQVIVEFTMTYWDCTIPLDDVIFVADDDTIAVADPVPYGLKKVFRAVFEGSYSSVEVISQICLDNACFPQSLVAFVVRDEPGSTGTIVYADDDLSSGSTSSIIIPVGTADNARDITVKVPVADLEDPIGSNVVISALAGAVSDQVIITSYDLGASLNIVELILLSVPADEDTVMVTINSLQSLIIGGVAVNSTDCQEICSDGITTTLSESICTGNSYLFADSLYFTPGTYFDTITLMNGCDSIIQLDLLTLDTFYTEIDTVLCEGACLTINTTTYCESATILDSLQSQNGCDRIVEWHLMILEIPRDTLEVAICLGDSIEVCGNIFNAPGMYDIICEGMSTTGCDSIVQLNLTQVNTYYTEIDTVLCEGACLTINTTTYCESATILDSLQSQNGCDSIVEWHLMILEIPRDTLEVAICLGDSIEVCGNIFNAPGMYEIICAGMSTTGCDSIVQLNLTQVNTYYTEIDTVLCEGACLTINTTTYCESATILDSLQSQNGCDSIVEWHLMILEIPKDTLDVEVCIGDSVEVCGNAYDTSGVYDIICAGQASNGCDSLIFLNLIVLDTSYTENNVELCEGDCINIAGQEYCEAVVILDTLQSQNGCDSIIEWTVTVLDLPLGTIDQMLCYGDSIEVCGNIYITSGEYEIICEGLSSTGCDSLVYLNLEILSLDTTTFIEWVCAPEDTLVSLTSLVNQFGCDSIVTTVFQYIEPLKIENTILTCFLDEVGVFNDTIRDVFDCDSIILVTTYLLEQVPVLADDNFEIDYEELPFSGDVILNDVFPPGAIIMTIDSSANGTLAFNESGGFTFNGASNVIGSNTFLYEVCNPNCPTLCDTAMLTIDVEKGDNIQDVLTPENGDGFNDVFEIPDILNFPESELMIFNRWGDVIYRRKPYVNDWRGQNENGNELPSGTYFYMLKYEPGGRITKGQITIIR